MAERPADTKRKKISKAQQLTMVEVLGASLVLGTCLVLSIFMGKYISFNTRIITAKDEAIMAYDQTIRNVGVCIDKDRNGRLSDEELEECNPNTVALKDVVGSLRYNVFEVMAQDENLESVARRRSEACYGEDGEKIDYSEVYNQATTDLERQLALQKMKICSALRVIPDALPAQRNVEALMASLNQIFIISNLEPESIAPRDENITVTGLESLSVVPVTFRFNGDGAAVLNVLDNIERSIREYDITTATIEWSSAGRLSLQARANAYHLSEVQSLEVEETLKASSKRSTSGTSSRGQTGLDQKNSLMENAK